MLTETTVAFFLLACLVPFFAVNLHNILRARGGEQAASAHAGSMRPSSLFVGLAMIGTLVYFLAVVSYLFLVFSGSISTVCRFSWYLPAPTLNMQVPGLILTAAGYGLFIWSVVSRGRYAVSWQMPQTHRLVTWGPYRYVRHPAYLGYFLMFLGLFFLWPQVLTMLPWVAIPGYVQVTFDEEKLLVQHFGDEYEEYRRKAGRFIPGLR
jgi:protein-S-isoprenylcysteine O-methyltransferase Ste14